jgi:LPXTG-motif cell wall-anchored protein
MSDDRDPRVDPPVGSTPTVCVMPDLYQWPVLCDVIDPCSVDGTTSLYGAMDCYAGQPTMVEFCAFYVGHPACVGVDPPPVTVEVGAPPTLPAAATLPATGGGSLALIALGAVLLGASALGLVRR